MCNPSFLFPQFLKFCHVRLNNVLALMFYCFCQYRGYEITTQQTTATYTSDLSEKFYVQGLENSCKVVDLLAQKLLNDMTLD